ncbi:unnamed protein product [Rotaria socialis]|uniref:Peptidase C1A papain C-terminal domain-containing protein n=2 Tax=Rotaria socialis TaxID=392032 RepID=A0A821LG12_9BILA|nr:unnamed protein product [Rotaria socialis]CAF3397155.1 unnamed protein product [Rotaria socialis]CAF3457276.1 unnamed protein product [Rotaria socialis]CAF3737209.1 unnamed protein product [Rotaria socialis]CAF4365720.1 unnamed protein product [Rotaria socialis]
MAGLKYLYDANAKCKYRVDCILPSDSIVFGDKQEEDFSGHITISNSELPSKVDLRPGMTAVEDQGKIGSCVANACAENDKPIDISRLFLYYNAHRRAKQSNERLVDKGCNISNAIMALSEHGTCEEELWALDVTKINECSIAELYGHPDNYKIIDSLQLNVNLNEMKSCLAQGFPFIFGLQMSKDFSHGGKRTNGYMRAPLTGEKEGIKGYCYIAYDYMINPGFLLGEPHAIRSVEKDDMSYDHSNAEDSTDCRFDENSDEGENDDEDDWYIEEEDDGSGVNQQHDRGEESEVE